MTSILERQCVCMETNLKTKCYIVKEAKEMQQLHFTSCEMFVMNRNVTMHQNITVQKIGQYALWRISSLLMHVLVSKDSF